MSSPVTRQQVAELYVATFNRAPDAAGLDYWVNDSGLTIEGIAQSFFDQAETQTLYPEGTTSTAFVTAIYTNLFNRTPDAAGLAYWVAELDNATMTRSVMIEAMKNGALGTDATIIANKATVGIAYADAGLEGTTFSLASVTEVQTTVDAALASVVDLTPISQALVVGTETINGASGNDTFTAVASALSSERTLDVTDIVDGKTGTDTLSVSLNTSFAGFSTGKGISNVENINLTNATAIARSFDATGIAGVEKYTVDADSAAVSLTDVIAAVDVELKNQVSGTFSVSFKDVADDETDVVGNDEDAMTLTLNANGTVEDTATDAVEKTIVTATINDIEELTLDLVGANVVSLGANDATTLAITGAGSLVMDTVSSALTSIDGSAATGALTIVTTAVATAASLGTIKTGAGADTITIDSDDIKANATIAGGEGADKVIWTATTGATTQVSMTGVETIQVGAVGGAETISMSNVSGVTTINASASMNNNATFVNMAAQALTVNVQGVNSSNDTLSADAAGAATLNFTASAATLADGTENTAADANNADVTLSKATSLTVNAGAYTNSTAVISAAKATTVEVNVASGKDEDGVELSVFDGDITAALASSVNVNATGKWTGSVTAATASSFTVEATGSVDTASIVTAAATSGEITTGATTSAVTQTLTVTADDLESLTVNAGGNLTITNTTESLQELTVDTTRAFTMTNDNLVALASASLGGTATTAAVTLGNLGDGNNDYDMAIVATGLKAGLTVGTIDIEDDRNISITASGMTGDITIGNIGTTNDGANVTIVTAGEDVNLADITATGDVSITNSSSKTFTVTAISATDDVTLNLDATVGAISLSTIAGDAVVVDASSALGAITYGTITATTSATVRGSELKINTATVVLDATSNDVTATLTGGIAGDAFTVQVSNATNDLTSLSVTGGVGSDTLTLDGAGGAAITTTALTLSSVENIVVDSTADVTINASAISGSTVVIEDVNGTDVLGLTGTDSADTIDLSTLGNSTGIILEITAGKGNDTIKLSSDAQIVDNIQFASTVANNGVDTITGYTSATDTLNFAATLVTNAIGTEADTLKTIAAAGTVANTDRFVEITTALADDALATAVTTLNGLTTSAVAIGDSFIAFMNDGTDGYLYLVEQISVSNTIATQDVTLLATLTGVTDIADGDLVSF